MAQGVRRRLVGIPAVTFAAIGAIWLLPFDIILRSLVALITSIAVLLAQVLIHTPIGPIRASPDNGLAFLARRLRAAGLQVRKDPGKLTVRIGPLLYLQMKPFPVEEGIEVRYRVDLDPVGWAGYAFVFGLVALLPFGIPHLLVGLRVSTFHERTLASILPATGEIPTVSEAEALRELLIDNLSECHRLASEAYESARSAYWDFLGLAVLTGVLAAGLLVLASLLILPEPDVFVKLYQALPIGIIGSGVATGAFAYFIRRRLRPRLLSYRGWRDRLRIALEAELAGSESLETEESRFETIVAAAREAPDWIEARRRAGLSADLGMWSLFYITLGWAIQLSLIGAYRIGTDPVVGVAVILASVPFVGILYLWGREWARRQRQAAQRHHADWIARFEELRSRMEAYLQDL